MSDTSEIYERLRALEVTGAERGVKLENMSHGMRNLRMVVDKMSDECNAQHQETKTELSQLSRTLIRVGASLTGAGILILLSIISYFIISEHDRVKKFDETMQELKHDHTK